MFTNSVNAETINKNTIFATCNYATTDGQYEARFDLYKTDGNSQNDGMISKNIVITKFNGKNENNSEPDKGTLKPTSLAIVTGECPKYLAIAKGKNNKQYYTALYNDYNSAKNYLSDNDGTVLTLTSDYLNMLKSMENFNNYTVEKHTCTQWSGGSINYCQTWKQESKYKCDYGNGLTRTFAENYKGALSATVATLSETATNNCPTVAYEIIKDGKQYYKYMGDWPSICSDNSVQCNKYIYGGNKESYQSSETGSNAETFTVYGKYATRSSLTNKYNENDILLLTVSGKTDGTIDTMTIKIQNKTVSLAGAEVNKIKSYFTNFAKSGGKADFPSQFHCGDKDKMIKKGYNVYTGYNGLSETDTFCTDTQHFGYSKSYSGGKYYYLMDQSSEAWGIDLEHLINSIDTDYSTKCNDVNSDECKEFQREKYEDVKKVNKMCQKIYADGTSIESDIKLCDTFKQKLNDWASAGYFGNRIISGSNGTDCEGILGSLGVWLSRIYNILKLAVPVIIVAMGFKDFIQGMSSGKDDALKKAGTNFIKRLVVGAVFVMLPILIKMILTFAFGGSFSDICIKL